jgi:hypothetical protein
MDTNEIMSFLKGIADISDVAHKTTFRCFRKAKDGTEQELIVDVYDHGTTVDSGVRYYCRATSENGNTAHGNSAKSVEEALAILHWSELDR